MRKTIGILAHVDAGKTTFSEQLLLSMGALRAAGRVDHGDTLLDHHPLERARGITIFCDQAVVQTGGDTLYLLDTPGHPDFVAEAERAMPAMDFAVLLVSAAEGIESHTETLWRLLEARGIPVFLFLNKCDLPSADPDGTLSELQRRFSADVLDLRSFQETGTLTDALREEIALRDEALLERYMAGEVREDEWLPSLTELIRKRLIFPAAAGSALRDEGIGSFIRMLLSLTATAYEKKEAEPLSAVCCRVRRIEGQRLCFLKLLSGALSLRDTLPGMEDKVNAIYSVHGEKLRPLPRAAAGDLVALPGLPGIRPGSSLGSAAPIPAGEPMMVCDVLWDSGETPAFRMLERLRELEDEDPALHVSAEGERLSLRVSGKLQTEVLASLAAERWGQRIAFGPARVLYRETVAAPAIGIGHYEPLRHYAEVHLRLLPGEPGSGIRFESLCSVNDLALNWQRLIETHVFEREHKGVLTGAPLTDVRVQLLCGRAHLKHTEGGDFRQAVGRAIRNALMQAQNVLLEPICRFRLRVPAEMLGRVSSSLAQLRADCGAPALEGAEAVLSGEVPFARFIPWQEDFPALTKGRGVLSVALSRYAPCSAEEQRRITEAVGYNPLADDTPDSVFCAHGAGYTVAWDKVKDFAHLSHEAFLQA